MLFQWRTEQEVLVQQCADIILFFIFENTCELECLNDGLCWKRECSCRDGFEGKQCEIEVKLSSEKYFERALFSYLIILVVVFGAVAYKLYFQWKEYKEEKTKKEVSARNELSKELSG